MMQRNRPVVALCSPRSASRWFRLSNLRPCPPGRLGVIEIGPLDFEVWHEGGQTWLFVAVGESGDVLAIVSAGCG